MTAKTMLVTGLGHAILDISARVDQDFIARSGLTPGAMTLIDQDTANALASQLDKTCLCAGGSASNTVADLAELGAPCGFLGRCAVDDPGRIYVRDMHARKIAMSPPTEPSPPATGCSIILVAPDGERTMATCTGAAAMMEAGHVDTDLIARSDWLFVEAYIFDMPACDQVIHTAIASLRTRGGKIAVGLSDAGCIVRHRNKIARLITDDADLVVGNIDEARAMFPDSSDAQAISKLAGAAQTVAITCGPQAAVIVDHGMRILQEPPACQVVDTTGAGDCFAAGFLYALSNGLDASACAQMGHRRAARCIGRDGARGPAEPKLSVRAQ